MKTVLWMMLIVVSATVPTPVHGQGGEIVLYVDPFEVGARLCWFDDWSPGGLQFVTVYVVHEGTTGARGVRFRLEKPDDVWWGYWWTTSPYAVTGYPDHEGITVEYGACLQGNIAVAELLYENFPPSAMCRLITPVAHADAESGEIEVTLCDGSVVAGGGRPLTVNLDTDCPVPWCLTVPVEPSTWGRIKALYGD